jgi:allophanate hydrolase
VDLVVVGAHLRGQPLNGDLVASGATLVGAVRTAPTYRLWALATTPAKPGLIRVDTGGSAVVGERWRMSATALGALVSELPVPMTIGRVQLADRSWVPGFLVEAAATVGAQEITGYGGWLAYLAAATSSREPG